MVAADRLTFEIERNNHWERPPSSIRRGEISIWSRVYSWWSHTRRVLCCDGFGNQTLVQGVTESSHALL